MPGGRPPTPNVERPRCPLGHEGAIQLSGHVRGRAGLYDRPRFRCMPKSGGTPHKFQPDVRVRHEVHGARIECDGCERPLGRRDGTRVGSGFEFAVREIADALVRVGQGSSYREASFAVRMRAKKRRVRSAIPIKTGLISDDPSLAMNYLDAFAEMIIGEVAEKVWPAYLALDALPLRVRVHQPQLLARTLRKKKAWPANLKKRTHPRKVYKIRRNATIRERGRILVAVGSNTVYGKPRPILARFAGGGDEESWVEFLRALPGVPAWVVSDRDGAIEAAVKRVWPAGSVVHLFSEFHLAKNAGDAARADKVPFGDPMRELLEDIQADPTIYPDAESFAAQRGFVRLTKWLADNRELICVEQPAKRAVFPNAPRSNGAVEATIEKIKTAVKGRAHLFGNADRLDLARVGISPEPNRLCTAAARNPDILKWADGRGAFLIVPEVVTKDWGIDTEGWERA